MPTIGTKPSLEATQAVGAMLLHQFARQRFSDAGIDENLIMEAENRVHINELAETLLHEAEPSTTNTSLEVINDTTTTINNNESTFSLNSDGHNNTSASTNQQDCSASMNGSSLTAHGDENFHSMMSESTTTGHNGTATTMVQDRTVYHSMNASNRSTSAFDRVQASPSLASYGKELRRIAEEFERSRLRQTVKDRAGQVNLSDITRDSFVKLLEELFQEKVTREKIVILFFFCTDVALRAAMKAQRLVIELMGWSFSYIIERVCSFIHQLGGWDKVLFYQLPSILITCCAALAICSLVVYLKKNLLRGP